MQAAQAPVPVWITVSNWDAYIPFDIIKLFFLVQK